MKYSIKNLRKIKINPHIRIPLFLFIFLLFALIGFNSNQQQFAYQYLSISKPVIAKSITTTRLTSQNIPLPIVAVNIDPNPEKKYEIIPVVGGKTLASDLASANINQNDSNIISVYTVREGDTIDSIAKMFGVSVNTIIWANDLVNKKDIKVGDNITILPVSGIKYSIKKGDNIESIAKKYNADIDEIYKFNDLDKNTKLSIGMSIIIPDAELSFGSNGVVRALNGMIVPDDPLLVNVRKLADLEDYYSCPVVGRLTQGLHGRNSVDLGAPIGTAVHASAEGSVTVSKNSGWNGGYGNFVVISHQNGTQTLYAHMQKSVVSIGDKVKSGDIIGYVGVSGMTTGPHLHFEVRGAKNPFAGKKCI